MLLEEDDKRKREILKWVTFEDSWNGVSGYAKDWYFLVHSAFKPALDIYHVERIDPEKTKKLRDTVSLKLTGLTHDDFKKKITAEGKQFAKTSEHKEIMKSSIKVVLETQGNPMLFSFRPTDGLESRNGEWYVQVGKSAEATTDSPGLVSFTLYEKNKDPKLAWSHLKFLDATQEDFVALLRTGKCKAVNLLDMKQPLLI